MITSKTTCGEPERLNIAMVNSKDIRRIWLEVKDEGISNNLMFISKHFWDVNHETAPHVHQNHELIYVFGGQGHIYSNNVTYTLSQGDLLVVEPDVVHQGRTHSENPFQMITIGYNFYDYRLYADPVLYGLDQVFLNLFKKYKIKTNRPIIPNCRQISKTLKDLFAEALDKQLCWQEKMRACLIQLFIFLGRKLKIYVASDNIDSDKVESIIRTKKYIASSFHKPLCLEDIARVACLSQSHFCRIFKKETGFTPVEYLNSVRLENAKTLLLYSNFTLTEIADMTGFSGIHYFSRIFKKNEGLSPSRYRQMIELNKIESR